MKLRSLLAAALVLGATFTMSAEQYVQALKVEKKDGTTDTYLFSAKPEITFEGRKMLVTTTDASTSYRLKEIAQYFFSEVSEIESVEADEVRFVTIAPGIIDIISQSPVCEVCVYDLQGRAVAAKVKTENTTVHVDLTTLATGFYILNTPKHSIKIRR